MIYPFAYLEYVIHIRLVHRRILTFFIKQFEHVDNAPLILFRICFGFLLAAESFGAILTGWVKRVFIDPNFTFTTIGFEWMQPLDGYGMYIYFIIMGVCGIGVMLGYRYHLSLSIFMVLWFCVYTMQKSSYNNHYYLLILLCLMMFVVPANAYLSIDAKGKKAIQSLTCRRWHINIFIFLLLIVYSYAALHKLYPGWLNNDFISASFRAKAAYPIIGDFLQDEIVQQVIIYGGIFFDGTIIIFLIINRTRKIAFVVSIFFHLFNSIVFQIGIFPYLMIGASALFFPPETIRNTFFKKKPKMSINSLQVVVEPKQQWIVFALCLFFAHQIYLPLRHHFYEGNVFYTEEGHRLSWRMMLRFKTGTINYQVKDVSTDSTWMLDPKDHMTPKQSRAMAAKPDMIWQFAQRIKKENQSDGRDVKIFVNAKARLNLGEPYVLIDPKIDLAQVKWERFKHSDWIWSPK